MGADWRQQEELEHEQWVKEYEQHETRRGVFPVQSEESDMKWADHGGGDFEQPPVGTHAARCVAVIDIGTQRGEYQGKATARRQCIIGWELSNELMTEGDAAGKPFAVSKFYTASLSEKANLRKDLENWRGRSFTPQELGGFESKAILGKCCMLSLTMNDKEKVRVTGVMALPKGMEVPPQVNPSTFFSLDEFDEVAFEALSEGRKKMVIASPEYQEILRKRSGAPASKGGSISDMPSDDLDSIPF